MPRPLAWHSACMGLGAGSTSCGVQGLSPHLPFNPPPPPPPTTTHPPTPTPQTMTFAVNYVGEPFNTPLLENRMFAASVRWSAALYIALVIDIPRGEPPGWQGSRPFGRRLPCKAVCTALVAQQRPYGTPKQQA